MANIEDLKKIAEENGVELTEDMLEEIAGGAFTDEEWANLTPEQRKKYRDESFFNKMLGKPCILD